MKKLLLDIHLYLGLVFAPYFVIYGLSTLAFQHGWGWSPTNTTTTHTVQVPEGLEDPSLGAAVRDSLGLIGHVPDWQISTSDQGISFRINRPGRNYYAQLNRETGTVELREENFGIWGIIKVGYLLNSTNHRMLWCQRLGFRGRRRGPRPVPR